jgi:hypothetical protein
LLFLVGLGWTEEQINIFNELPRFEMSVCQRTISIFIDKDGTNTFPSVQTETSSTGEEILKYFANFAIINTESELFQILDLSMKFDSVDYNWFAGGQSNINEEYTNALESRVEQLYRESWIGQYFDYDIISNDGNVFFWSKLKKSPVDSYRFQIFELIPKNSRPYFLSKSEWPKYSDADGDVFVEVSLLSNTPHGFKTKPFPSAKSIFYKAPFFLVFKASHSVDSNYLLFTSFNKPNVENCILAMLDYNENEDTFVSQFSPGIILPYLKSLSLSNKLEFNLFDTEEKQVQISDKSQIFILLHLL